MGDWSFFGYNYMFLIFEFLSIHMEELTTTAIAGIVAVSVVTFLVMPHWTAIIFVFPLMIILYIDLLGTIQLAGLHVNVIVYVGMLVSIGLLVDFIMHMLLRYYESTATNRVDKVKDAIQSMGSSILLGGISTFLGVLPLVISTSEIFQNLFICFLAMVILGVTHGLILLPVMLSLIGPDNYDLNHKQILKSGEKEDVEGEISEHNNESIIDIPPAIKESHTNLTSDEDSHNNIDDKNVIEDIA